MKNGRPENATEVWTMTKRYLRERETMLDQSGKVIRRTYHGGTEDVTLEEFATSAIQDDQMACQIALAMIEGNDPYQYNPDEPEFYEEFTVIDREGLLRDLLRVTEDGIQR